jgi:hypothetical protein
MKRSRLNAVGTLVLAALPALLVPASSQALAAGSAKSGATEVMVRVEGISSTLLPETAVATKASTIVKDGKSADACEGDTAAVALQDATKGHWTAGTFSSGLGYPVIGIKGEDYPFTSSYYWSFWVDGKPGTTGICGAKLHQGEHLLFDPQCSAEVATSCPQGNFDPPVLSIVAPKRAKAGKAVTLGVFSLANFTGKSSPAAGVKVSAAGHTLTTGSSGKAKLTFAKAGSYRVTATSPGSIRDELVVKVS